MILEAIIEASEQEEKSLKLISQLQDEEEKEEKMIYKAMREASEQEALEKFKCEICLELLTENELIPLAMCEHVFHSQCLA